MIDYKQAILTSRINTILGSLLVGSWALGCGLLIWQVSFGQNPLTNAFIKIIASETQPNF